MITYWQVCHFNAVVLMQETEPWNICSWDLTQFKLLLKNSLTLLLKKKNEHSFTLTVKDQKDKLRKQSHLPLQPKK